MRISDWSSDVCSSDLTHHHPDHVGGNLALKEATGCTIIGPEADADRIPGIDIAVGDNEGIDVGSQTERVFEVPGPTRGHIAYWFAVSHAIFCAYTTLAVCQRRAFGGTPGARESRPPRDMALPSHN